MSNDKKKLNLSNTTKSYIFLLIFKVDLKHIDEIPGSDNVAVGIDLSEFLLSVEWDLLAVPATRNEEYYPCCTEPYAGSDSDIIVILFISLGKKILKTILTLQTLHLAS